MRLATATALMAAVITLHTNAQEAPPAEIPPAPVSHAPLEPWLVPTAAAVSPACCTAPSGTLVDLSVDEPLDSARNHRGDRFVLVLHSPISVEGVLLVPAGATGVGEVVHAAPSRGGGKPGELILAARYLEHDGRQIPLRGMKLSAVGKDNTQKAMAVGIALGPFGQLVRGGDVRVAKGALAQARLAADIALQAPADGEAGSADAQPPPLATPPVPPTPVPPTSTNKE